MAEIIREKGTDRSRFFRGQVDKYTWVDIGSSFLPSELNAAYLWPQLEQADEINENRLASWRMYHELLKPLADLFDDETMRQLNARVDVDHESPSKVAADFLRQHPLN